MSLQTRDDREEAWTRGENITFTVTVKWIFIGIITSLWTYLDVDEFEEELQIYMLLWTLGLLDLEWKQIPSQNILAHLDTPTLDLVKMIKNNLKQNSMLV